MSIQPPSFTILSLNLWNDKEDQERRIRSFCERISNMEQIPDVICLQEVNYPIFKTLLNQHWTAPYFSSITPSILEKNKELSNRDAFEVIFSKFPITLSESFPFQQSTGNQFVHVIDLQIPLNYFPPNYNYNILNPQPEYTKTITIMNTQLEKLKAFSEMRKQQLYGLFSTLVQRKTAFICSDTQFTDEDEDFITLPEPWGDVFEQASRKEEDAFTYDSEVNKYISGFQQCRFDRIFYKLNGGWKCTQFELLFKDEPVSSHSGIFASFELIGSN